MKTFFKYCLFIFALAFSQMSWAADNDNCPLDSKGGRISNCVNPSCSPGKETYGTDNRKCIDSCRSGYSATSSADFICYENCRKDFHPTGVFNCTRDGSLSYAPALKTTCPKNNPFKCRTRQDDCRDGYDKVAGVCWAHVYQKGSYVRGETVRWKDTCPAGYSLKTNLSGLYYYCQLCNSNPTTSTALAINGGSYYNISGNPNSKIVTLQSTVDVTVPLCNASGGTITTKFTGTNGGVTKDLGTCTLKNSSGVNTTGAEVGTFTCTISYTVDTTGTWVVSGQSLSNLGGKGTNLASPSNNGSLSFTVNP